MSCCSASFTPLMLFAILVMVFVCPLYTTNSITITDNVLYSRSIELFPSFGYDSGWIGIREVGVRLVFNIGAGTEFSMPGQGILEWPSLSMRLQGTAASGQASMNIGVEAQARLRIDIEVLNIIDFEWEGRVGPGLVIVNMFLNDFRIV